MNGEPEPEVAEDELVNEDQEQSPPAPVFAEYVGGSDLAFAWAGLVTTGDIVLVWDYEAEERFDLELVNPKDLGKPALIQAVGCVQRHGVADPIDVDNSTKDELLAAAAGGLITIADQAEEE